MYKTCKVSLSIMIWCKIYYLFWKFCRYRPTTPYSGRKIFVCLWYHSSEMNCNVYPDHGFSWYGSSSVMARRSRPKAESSDVDESRQLQRWSWKRGEVLKLLKTKAWWGADAEASKSEGLVGCCWRWKRGGLLKLLNVNARWSAEAGEDVVVVVKIKAWRYVEASKGEGLVGCKWRWDRGATWYYRNRYAFSDEFKITKQWRGILFITYNKLLHCLICTAV